MIAIFLKFYIIAITLRLGAPNFLKSARDQHKSLLSTNSDFRYLASLTDTKYLNKVLDNILIPRVSGTPNHDKVVGYIENELQKLNWHVHIDEFVDKAPIFGNVKFKNIVASLNPKAERFLVLACHSDSKYFKDEVFVGAIDSAVPCAMMLEIAKTLSRELKENKDSNVGLKFIFFDGEEAFLEWGPNDSLYGAKHLARSLHNNRSTVNGDTISELDRIDILVLLDIIGMKHPNFNNYFRPTQTWFMRLAEIEDTLHRMDLLKNHRYRYFQTGPTYSRIEDDHIPFLNRGVPILHLIGTPFPPQWHTPKDNRDIIDMDTVVNINLILKTFISEYLHLLV